ncbi:MAG: DUF5672 family protein [Casimicrobiaceae bacterium]
MLELPAVTLCCIDTANHALALRALHISSSAVRFARTLFITDRDSGEAGIDFRIVPAITSRDDYSCFVLKSLLPHIETSHVLLVQWDGYVVNPQAWRADFLDSDYLGAKWFWYDDALRVGNGGFSLRSRKLLAALQDPRIVLTEAEDVTIGRAFRPLLEREHGIRFGTEAQADRFAFEAAYPVGFPFGFHGLFNFCRVVPPDELASLVRHFTPSIARSPQLASLARNCLALGQWAPAAAIFQRILDELPDDAPAAAGLATASKNAVALPAVGRNDPCPCGSGKRYKHCHGAVGTAPAPSAPPVTTPSSTEQRLGAALAAHQRGDVRSAEVIYREVLATAPAHPLAQHYLGVIEYQRGDLAAALPRLEAARDAAPREPEFHGNLGLAYAAADREADAIAAYRAALALKADHAIAWNNLGLALQSQNDVAGAIDAFRQSIAHKADFANAHWNLSLALLLDGQYSEGWREYDWRLSLAELGKGRHVFPGPAWDGVATQGKTLLLYTEQGIGDAVQFARYVPALAASGAKVVIHCAPPLHALLASVAGAAQVISGNMALLRCDAHFPLMSLPRHFATTLATIPAKAPYISVAPARRGAMRTTLDARAGRLRVGLAWVGNRTHTNDRNRSLHLSTLAALFDVHDIAWFSLQQGDAAVQVAAVRGAADMLPLDPTASLDDTAALIAELDLIISVDTSIVHLAGALGRPCWVLLPFAPDWRWLLRREDSPWYPSLRLFRQSALRDWASVVARVATALRARTLH